MGHNENRGREYHIRNIVYHKLSPFELSVYRSVIESLKTMPRRINYWIPFLIFPVSSYLLIDWMNRANEQSHRKNPKDFENDE